jgi:hypothetical protein
MKKIIIVLAIFLAAACGNTVEDQKTAWESNKTTVENYVSKYPYLAEKINAQYTKAKESMESANQISDEKKRIKAMKNANSICLDGAIEETRRFEREIESIKNRIASIKEGVKSSEFSQKTAFLLEEANNSLTKAEAAISSKYTSADSALTIFAKELRNLESLERGLDRHYHEILSNRHEDTAKNSAVKSSNSTNASKSAVVATFKCKKCGGLLKEGDVKCKYCGAPVKK